MNTRTYIFLFALLFIFSCNSHRMENAKALFEQGKELEALQMPDSAIIIYQKAIKELENVKGDTLSGVIYNRIGDVMFHNALYGEAFEPYSKGLIYNSKMNDKTQESKSLRGMGKSKLFQSSNTPGFEYFKKALLLIPYISDQEEISLIHNNLSLANLEIENYKLSLFHNTKAIQLSRDSLNIYKNYNIRACLFMKNHQYDSALVYYKLGCKSKDLYTQASCYYDLIDLAKATNKIDSTKFISMFLLLKDSIENRSKPFKILKKDKQFQVKVAQKAEKCKYTYYIIGILTLSLIIIFLFIKRHRTEKKKRSGDILKHHEELSEMQKEQKKQKE